MSGGRRVLDRAVELPQRRGAGGEVRGVGQASWGRPRTAALAEAVIGMASE
jgi:hypothetical protein